MNKMKLAGVAVAVVMVAGIARSQPEQTYIATPYNALTLFNFAGQELTGVDNLVFQLVVDPSGNTDFNAMINAGRAGHGWGIGSENFMDSGSTADYGASDDVVIGHGYWEAHPTAPNPVGRLPQVDLEVVANATEYWSTPFYFRWFNSDNPETATQAGVIYSPNAGHWVTQASALDASDAASLVYGVTPLDGVPIAGSEHTGTSAQRGEVTGWQTMPMVPEPGTFVLFGIGLLTVVARRRKAQKTA